MTSGHPSPSHNLSLTPHALVLALSLRLLPALILPQTFFQPDEFYQALEPAHNLVYGYGHLTWEWRDLPTSPGVSEIGKYVGEWYDQIVVQGRMRGWAWPGVFALVYQAMERLGVSERFFTFGPRLIGVVVAALTDWTTYRLANKVLGPGAGPAALFLSLTSLFNAHILPRALSTSPETLMTALALLYFPLPRLETPEAIGIGTSAITRSLSTKGVPETHEKAPKVVKQDAEIVDEKRILRLGNVRELDYAMMDRMGPSLEDVAVVRDNLPLSAMFATMAMCVRPTTAPLWLYLGAEHVIRSTRQYGALKGIKAVVSAIIPALCVLIASTGLDYCITGRLYIPILTFIHYNFLTGLSASFGATSPFYHLTQSLPIMLFPIWFWFTKGFISSFLPQRFLPRELSTLDRPAPLRTLSRALVSTISVLSTSPHSEWRFLHPLLPSLLLFALPPLFRSYTPIQGVAHQFLPCLRQYLRLQKRAFYLILLTPILPFLYLNVFHGAAQVRVMDVLRKGKVGEVSGLAVLMPCHSTPWMSHLHRDIPAWFLTCEPPIGVPPGQPHHTPQSIFYDEPIPYLQTIFPYPPSPLHKVFTTNVSAELPSHILLFGTLLDIQAEGVSVRDTIMRRGYEEVWSGWNGFDWAQDEEGRKGGVRVWRLIGDGPSGIAEVDTREI